MKLTKLSIPDFTLDSDYPLVILGVLNDYVCPSCKLTLAEWNQKALAGEVSTETTYEIQLLEEGRNPYTFSDFFPEDWKSLPAENKIDLLLNTACGCEFMLED